MCIVPSTIVVFGENPNSFFEYCQKYQFLGVNRKCITPSSIAGFGENKKNINYFSFSIDFYTNSSKFDVFALHCALVIFLSIRFF